MAEDDLVLVIRKKLLFGNDYFQGFSPIGMIDYESRILANYGWIRKGNSQDKTSAEGNTQYKHPIAYALIANLRNKEVFAYQRAEQDSKYPEKRLQGKWSLGVGGHIKKSDVAQGNPIKASFEREALKEEVEIRGSTNPKLLGYINDDLDDVGQVHFGILYLIETDAEEVVPIDKEIAQGRLRTISEIEKILKNPIFVVEGWSKIAFSQLRKILS